MYIHAYTNHTAIPLPSSYCSIPASSCSCILLHIQRPHTALFFLSSYCYIGVLIARHPLFCIVFLFYFFDKN